MVEPFFPPAFGIFAPVDNQGGLLLRDIAPEKPKMAQDRGFRYTGRRWRATWKVFTYGEQGFRARRTTWKA